jgi:Fic family protein
MRQEDFTRAAPGTLVQAPGASGNYWAFVPNPLPPTFDLTIELVRILAEAHQALGELNGVGRMLPNPDLLIGPSVRCEAVASSRIEGTTTNFQQLLVYEADPTRPEDAADREEVSNYVRALKYGLERLNALPVSLRLMCEVHERLMAGVRGGDQRPGVFRDRQNMIARHGQTPAEARFVPPPVPAMYQTLDQLEKFIAYPSGLPVLVELGLIHYQFETIHPFLDGNGRLGRLLISLLLCERRCLGHPLLYLSSYLERNRESYLDHLLAVSQTGDWTGWLRFFLQGIAIQSRIAVERCRELLDLRSAYREQFQRISSSSNLSKLVDHLFERPAISIPQAAQLLGITWNAAQKNIERLEQAGIVLEVTGKSKRRIYVAREIIALIEKPEPSDSM